MDGSGRSRCAGSYTDNLYWRWDDDHVGGTVSGTVYCQYCGELLGYGDQTNYVDVDCNRCGYELQIGVHACKNSTCMYGAARHNSKYGSRCTQYVTCTVCDGTKIENVSCSTCKRSRKNY